MSFGDLPLLADLLKSHTCKTGAVCECKRKTETKVVPDPRLKNWEEWMSKRKKMHNKLKSLLKRESGEMVMNASEELRTIREGQIAIQYTKIAKPDPQRGCPAFWKLPFELKGLHDNHPSCFGVMPKEEKCEIPIIEHVGVPAEILKEKDVLPRTRNLLTSWENSNYLKEKRVSWKDELLAADPHPPDTENLIVTGIGFGKIPETLEKTSPLEKVTGLDVIEITKKEEEISVLSLSVNNLHLSPSADLFGTRKICLLYDYDLNRSKIATEYLNIQNLGTTTIRFFWKFTEPFQLFKDILPKKRKPSFFYFNKNKQLILPGQTQKFPIWFKTETPGVHCEEWEFCTKPCVAPHDVKIVITLHASAVLGDLEERMNIIRERLDRNVRNRLIRNSLSAVLSNIPYEKYKPTVYSYNKKDVFEAVNSKFSVLHKQPQYLYNKEVVRELQKIYKFVRRQYDPKCWNYRIDELRLLTRAKYLEQEESRRYSEKHSAKIKIAEKSDTIDDKAKETNEALEILLGDSKNLPEALEKVIIKLEQYSVDSNLVRNKYSQSYLILCTCFSKMEEDIEELKEKLGIIKICTYPQFLTSENPLFRTPTRLVYESLPHVLQGPQLVQPVGLPTDLPAAECLQDIPMQLSKKRFRTYYNLPDTPPIAAAGKKGGKKGGKKDAKSAKGKGKPNKKDKKGKASDKSLLKANKDSDEDAGLVINKTFDPYAKVKRPSVKEEVVPFLEEEINDEEQVTSNINTLSSHTLSLYNTNIYVIVYKHLERAIINIVDMIEIQEKSNVPYAVVKEIESENYNHRLIDLKGLILQEASDKVNSKRILENYRKRCKKDWETLEMQKQIKNVKSESSLWSVLKGYQSKMDHQLSKPISYPMDHYDKGQKDEAEREVLTVHTSTSGGALDPNWLDFKDVGAQQDYGEEEEPDDLVAYIERVVSEISVQDLHDIKFEKETQKNLDEHVSDEEYFYDSDSNKSVSSINSEQFVQDEEENFEEENNIDIDNDDKKVKKSSLKNSADQGNTNSPRRTRVSISENPEEKLF